MKQGGKAKSQKCLTNYSWINLVVPKKWAAYFSAISGRKFDLTTVLRSCWHIEWRRRGFIFFLPFGSGTSSARNKNQDHLSIETYPKSVGNMASETTSDHWKVVFLMSKSEKKWEKGAWSNETPPTPFYRSTRSQNSCQIEFSSRNGREISGSVFWND